MIRTAFILAAFAAAALATTAHAADKEKVYQHRFCAGMQMEVRMPNGTRADCMSDRLAIEVDFADKWHQALGQAMSYAASTDNAPAIILICRKSEKSCQRDFYKLMDTATFWRVPVVVWQCSVDDKSLADCPRDGAVGPVMLKGRKN